MDDIIEAVVELLGDLLEMALKGIKNLQKRKWALTVFYVLITLGITGFLLWSAGEIWKDGNKTGAGIFAGIAVILCTVFGFFIIRGHKRNWKSKREK